MVAYLPARSAYGRFIGRRRRVFRRRRYGMKRRPLRRATQKVFAAKRWVMKLALNGDDAVPTGQVASVFSLSDVPAYTDITNLFDAYKITGIRYRWLINRNPDLNTTAGYKGRYVRINHVVDHNDSLGTTLAELQQYPNMKEEWLNDAKQRTRWYYMKPNTLDLGYTSGLISNYAEQYNRWIGTNDTGAVYYGIKWIYDSLYAGQQLQFECQYYIKAKQQK